MLRSRRNRTSVAGKAKHEALIIILLLLGWFTLQAFVLPRLGVST
jgi:hypothetical protein